MLDSFSLEGKVAIVTGSSTGLGQGMCIGLASAGADVVGVDYVASPETKATVEKKGRRFHGMVADLLTIAPVERIIKETVDAFGRLDILVNNAATFSPRAMLDADEDFWDRSVDVDLKGYFFMCQAAGKHMVEAKSGSIVNVVSVNAMRPNVNSGVYAICKAGVLLMTKAMAKEWGPYGIRVNAIAPGVVETTMSRPLRENPERLSKHLEKTPLGRIIQPHELVGAALLLASDAASSITGQILAVDGGESI